ncbi:nuclease-related domain-containing protein [Streptomyces sp. TRM70308]|uniref:nuclease-related domain-containing protein n=1 Tax=Streptomyces sp. TRM70308 TaxID=3131932 RepID=UPI003D029E89
MIETLLILGAAVWVWHRWRSRPTAGAGGSADARARQLRTPLVQLAERLGFQTRRSQQARQYAAGAAGERRTAARIDVLRQEGWTVLHDRALPRSRANVDHLAISPTGAVLLPDSKRWSARYPLSVRGGRLWHGHRDVTDRLRGLRHECAAVAAVLGVPVTPLIAMDGARLAGPDGRPTSHLVVDGIRIVPASRLAEVLREVGRVPGQRRPADLAEHAHRALPPFGRW